MSAWAARYSPTRQPELTIYRDGVEVDRMTPEYAADRYFCPCSATDPDEWGPGTALHHDPNLRADIAARVPVTECTETQACTRHAMPDGRCREHGGRDEL